jgi:hypothetical protein
MAQIARNMSMAFSEEKAEFQPTHIVHDRNSKFTEQFCSILETNGIEFRPIPARSLNMNPFAEAWVGRTKAECLNHVIVLGEAQVYADGDTSLATPRRSGQASVPRQGVGTSESLKLDTI